MFASLHLIHGVIAQHLGDSQPLPEQLEFVRSPGLEIVVALDNGRVDRDGAQVRTGRRVCAEQACRDRDARGLCRQAESGAWTEKLVLEPDFLSTGKMHLEDCEYVKVVRRTKETGYPVANNRILALGPASFRTRFPPPPTRTFELGGMTPPIKPLKFHKIEDED